MVLVQHLTHRIRIIKVFQFTVICSCKVLRLGQGQIEYSFMANFASVCLLFN